MKYNDLPKWAQNEVKQWVKDHYLEFDKEARQSGEEVPYYTDEELEVVAMAYVNDRDDFLIEYDEETDSDVVVW